MRDRSKHAGRTSYTAGRYRLAKRSESAQEIEHLLLVVRVERSEALAGGPCFTVMSQDRLSQGRCSAVVQEEGLLAHAPQRRRAHLGPRRLSLHDAVP